LGLMVKHSLRLQHEGGGASPPISSIKTNT
jgi:hypothetical protein